MSDRAGLWLDHSEGKRLDLTEYRRDFWRRYAMISGRSSWKLERQQHFAEPGDPSWEAFRQGRWEEALRLFEGEREALARDVREDEANGHPFHRVRIVEEPLVPYLQWELCGLWVQAECGGRVRVVPGEVIRHLEGAAALPEVVVLGGEVLYEVCYTEAGVLDGGVRFTDAGLVGRWERFIAELYEKGEEMVAYAVRYLRQLPPPQPDVV
jgi:hypothetical protein